MTGFLRPTVRCDGCGVCEDARIDCTLADLRDAAGSEGWVHTIAIGGEVLDACPRDACQDAVVGMIGR